MVYPLGEGVRIKGNTTAVFTTTGKIPSDICRVYLSCNGTIGEANTGNITMFSSVNTDANTRQSNSFVSITNSGQSTLGTLFLGLYAPCDGALDSAGLPSTYAQGFQVTLINASGNTAVSPSKSTISKVTVEAPSGSAGANTYGGYTEWYTSNCSSITVGSGTVTYSWDVSSNTNLPFRWTNTTGPTGNATITLYY